MESWARSRGQAASQNLTPVHPKLLRGVGVCFFLSRTSGSIGSNKLWGGSEQLSRVQLEGSRLLGISPGLP